MELVNELESLFVTAANGTVEIGERSAKYLQQRVDMDRLNIQLAMLPDGIRSAFEESSAQSQITYVRTIADALSQSVVVRTMLSEVDRLIKLYLTFPVSSATAERSFSSLRRIKTFLRSTMTQHRLNNLFMLYVHCKRTDKVDLRGVANEFISANTHRNNFFGKF